MTKTAPKIKHILADGTRLDDIRGHVVRVRDARSVYSLMDKINEEEDKSGYENNGSGPCDRGLLPDVCGGRLG